jgi:hypothetical protein
MYLYLGNEMNREGTEYEEIKKEHEDIETTNRGGGGEGEWKHINKPN